MRAECVPIRFLACLLLGIFLSISAYAGDRPDMSKDLDACRSIENDQQRLRCYDETTGGNPGESGREGIPPEDKDVKKPSYFSRLWELEEETRRDKYSFSLHRPTYVLPFTYNGSPNTDAYREGNPGKELKNAELEFQTSFKVKLLQNILGREIDLWFGYTQRSFWQLYNYSDSSPFRETDYEPEFLLNIKTGLDIGGWKWRFMNFGLNHQSNGQSEPLSRSWNRVVANFGFEKDPFYLQLRTWYRIPESFETDDNPDIRKYLGHGELQGFFFYGKHRFGVMFRNNFDFSSNHGAVQVDWSFPVFFERIAGYLQYYDGYGESLLDYNHHVHRIGIGFMAKDWDQ